jgi:signal transduction histidine kinase
MRFIFTNLLTNAIKYSPAGGKIGFEFSLSGSNLHFIVSDEGIGIAPEDEKHLFEPFYRAGNAADIEGTGLGLSIVKRALDIQGGTIKYKSDLGKGTFVEINIPRV